MGLGDSLGVSLTGDHLLRLAVLILAGLAIAIVVRRLVGGATISYVTLVLGIAVLAAGEVLQLAAPLAPDWRLGDVDIHLPIYSGGYLLVLMGFMSLMHDMRVLHDRVRALAESERAKAESARLQEARLRALLDELNSVQTALRRERDFIQGILETNEVLIISISLADGCLTMFNRGAEHLTGYLRDEVLGHRYRDVFLAPEDGSTAAQLGQDLISGHAPPVGTQEHNVITKSGERRLISWKYTVCRDEAGRPAHVAAFGRDVTQQRQMQTNLEKAKADLESANKELERLATIDYVTGLVNRRMAAALFEREIARSRRHGTPLVVILLDLDDFKAVNDTYGHEVGDTVLKQVAQTLRGRLRTADIIARYGGDEFLLVLPEAGGDGAVLLAEVVRGLVASACVEHRDVRVSRTASLGITVMEPRQALDADQLIRRADEAMYRAKKLGGNRVVAWNCPAEAEAAPAPAGPPC
jgi:diguanylate cyclase (GGDEF)-like protein/PAS domain S-box-containing protein